MFKVILSNESNSDNTDILILISSVDNKSCMLKNIKVILRYYLKPSCLLVKKKI